jgi:hypothetical protein
MTRSQRIRRQKIKANMEQAFVFVLTISVFAILAMAANIAGGAI